MSEKRGDFWNGPSPGRNSRGLFPVKKYYRFLVFLFVSCWAFYFGFVLAEARLPEQPDAVSGKDAPDDRTISAQPQNSTVTGIYLEDLLKRVMTLSPDAESVTLTSAEGYWITCGLDELSAADVGGNKMMLFFDEERLCLAVGQNDHAHVNRGLWLDGVTGIVVNAAGSAAPSGKGRVGDAAKETALLEISGAVEKPGYFSMEGLKTYTNLIQTKTYSWLTGETGGKPQPPKQLTGIKVILLVGTDLRHGEPGAGNGDTIMLAFLDAGNKTVKLLSIPRDTCAYVPGSAAVNKINFNHAVGGIPVLKTALETMLGIRIDHYVSVNFEGFVQIVDAIGGIVLDVEQRMYNEEEGIALRPGKARRLNGEQALAFVRFRGYPLADLQRVTGQQYFLKELCRQTLTPANIGKLPELVRILKKNVKTDILPAAFSVADVLFAVDFSAVDGFLLPGRLSADGAYWIADEPSTRKLLAHLAGGNAEDFSLRIPQKETKGALRLTPYPI
ncbi:MAG: LCP family protein [Clostridiales bacterium]|nr:LCP family protein [Clostridiales bacterium]